MTILLIIILALSIIAAALTTYLLTIAKNDAQRLAAENELLKDEIFRGERELAKIQRRESRALSSLRNEVVRKTTVIEEQKEHHKQVVKDLNRRRQRMIDTYEEVLASHTLFPNYKPSHLSAA